MANSKHSGHETLVCLLQQHSLRGFTVIVVEDVTTTGCSALSAI